MTGLATEKDFRNIAGTSVAALAVCGWRIHCAPALPIGRLKEARDERLGALQARRAILLVPRAHLPPVLARLRQLAARRRSPRIAATERPCRCPRPSPGWPRWPLLRGDDDPVCRPSFRARHVVHDPPRTAAAERRRPVARNYRRSAFGWARCRPRRRLRRPGRSRRPRGSRAPPVPRPTVEPPPAPPVAFVPPVPVTPPLPVASPPAPVVPPLAVADLPEPPPVELGPPEPFVPPGPNPQNGMTVAGARLQKQKSQTWLVNWLVLHEVIKPDNDKRIDEQASFLSNSSQDRSEPPGI